MLGRLCMSTEEAMEHYNNVFTAVFTEKRRKKDKTFKEELLKNNIRNVIIGGGEDGSEGDERMLMNDLGNNVQLGNTYGLYLLKVWLDAYCNDLDTASSLLAQQSTCVSPAYSGPTK